MILTYNGSCASQNSDNPLIKRMWTTMNAVRPSAFTKSNKKGVERVKRGDYAYLMEFSSIEYEVERDCNLTAIGGLLDNKGYGIATPPGTCTAYVTQHRMMDMAVEA
ncbi:hypothetical protein HPB51_024568 [Rhipicephalus microplus]|uniref:Uncharacterized protein n=1 Tax=Rhipicephalus microplus TaxID=6941 RepID=A0A9J6DJV9_RHIMP|nr:hypothetical protein HPB51_024568 [Rhipicephalus microplus]